MNKKILKESISNEDYLISVIIPLFNSQQYVRTCVTSVIQQNDQNIEIILIDDGSTDNTLDICKDLSRQYQNIKVYSKPNGGASSARNYGIKRARGIYLMFLDSDDFWHGQEAIKSIKDVISCNVNVDIILYGAETININSNKICNKINFTEEDICQLKNNSFDDNIKYLYNKNKFPASAWSIVVRADKLIENEIWFREGIVAEDIDWIIALLRLKPKIEAVEDNFYRYHKLREGSVTSTSGDKTIQSLLFILNRWYSILKNGDATDQILLKFLSFHYSTIFLALGRLTKEKQKIYIPEISKYECLLRASSSSKIIVVRFLLFFLGFSRGSKTLHKIYSKYLKVK